MINETFKKYEEDILTRLGIPYAGLIMCELGNQSYAGKMAKQMYIEKGVDHTSIDINNLGGALPLNLDFPLPKNLDNKFSIITNYGTSEHVNNQYSVFRNIHAIGKLGCIMIHGVPLIGHWRKHGRYYYSREFFKELACACGYKLIHLKILDFAHYCSPKNIVACVLRKDKNVPFISLKKFSSIPGLQDSGNLAKTGNYSVAAKKGKGKVMINKAGIDSAIRQSTMMSPIGLSFIKNKLIEISNNNIEGDIVECGVWMGGCSATMAYTLLEMNDIRTVRLFDSFDDPPEPLPLDGKRLIKQVGGLKNAGGKLRAVKGFYKKRKLVGPGNAKHAYKLLTNIVGYPKERVKIYKGWFQKTIVPYSKRIDKIALLILDCDLYASIKICLENLYPKLVTNGFIIIDDYYYYDGAKLAVDEYLKNNGIIVNMPTDGFAWWKKQ